MGVTPSTMVGLGTAAPAFTLADTISGKEVSLGDYAGTPLLVMFICNHCPFVVHVMDELVKLGAEYGAKGLGVVAISSNDAATHPDDAPDKMGDLGKAKVNATMSFTAVEKIDNEPTAVLTFKVETLGSKSGPDGGLTVGATAAIAVSGTIHVSLTPCSTRSSP